MTRRLINEEGLFVGGSAGTAMHGAIEYCKKNKIGKGKRVVVILPDSLRNYITKVVSKEWMCERGYYDLKEMVEPDHPLKGRPLSEIKMRLAK